MHLQLPGIMESHRLNSDIGPTYFPLNFFNLLLLLKMLVYELIKIDSKRVCARFLCPNPL